MKRSLLFLAILAIGFTSAKAQIQSTQVITGLQYPIAFTFTPAGKIFVTLKPGTIRVYNANFSYIGVFYNLTDSTYDNFERGLLGIEVDPDYVNNGYVYAYYNHRCCLPNQNGQEYLRVVRFTDVNNVGTNPTIILSIPVNAIPGNHVGGNLRFRPSEPNQLYVSTGEVANPPYSQQLTNPFGKMLRINKDGTIPTTNPFYDDGNISTGNDDRIWAYGLRNSFDFTFSTFNDSMYVTENGGSSWDEVNYVMRGRNYGWQICEGNFIFNTSNPCNNPALVNPLDVWGSPLPAVTGVIHYTSTVFPNLTNHLLVANNDLGEIWDITLGNSPVYNTSLGKTMMIDLPGGLTTLKQGNEGCIYAMRGGYTTQGNITRLCPTGMKVEHMPALFTTVEVTPNPSQGTSELQFFLNKTSKVSVAVYDVTGNKVIEIDEKELAAGEHRIKIDATQLPTGIYFCTLQSGPESHTVRLAVVR